ncbi:MAG: LuxR C-terminal-related transcriptional regulator, partial [Gaiellaceae bacterium]
VAFSRGSPAAAAELAAHAVRLTPPEEGAGKRRALAEADYLFAAGDTSAASALLAQLVAAAPAGPERAQVLSRQARLHHFGQEISGSVGLLHRALAESGGDATLRGEIEEGLAWGLLLSREDLGGAAEHARSAAALAETRGDDAALAEALAVQALTEFVRGRPWEATMERALSLESATRHLRVLRHPSFAYGYCLSCSDDLDRARDVFEELLRRAAEAGDDGSVPSILNHLTLIECHAGRWARASVHADECYERALESGQLPTQASILGKKALLAAGRGDADVARALARDALPADFDPARPEDAMARGGETAVAAIGFLELSLGSAAEAERYLGPMTRSLLDAGVAEPGEVRSLADEIEALVALRRHSEAEELLTRLEAWASRLQRPSVLGIAARCRGVLEESVEKLEEAATYAALPFERGRTLLALGTQQRRLRQRRAARETLGRALAIFEELGAALMTHHTREELGRIGGRAPSSGELTATERRVAELVAAGRQNKEVAAELVVSVHTVEATLTRIYQKLDVRSRTELAARLNKD